eukprot:7209582-Prymnesium_polylepis.2
MPEVAVLRASTLGAGAAGEPILVSTEAICAKMSDFVRMTHATMGAALWHMCAWRARSSDQNCRNRTK